MTNYRRPRMFEPVAYVFWYPDSSCLGGRAASVVGPATAYETFLELCVRHGRMNISPERIRGYFGRHVTRNYVSARRLERLSRKDARAEARSRRLDIPV